MPLRFEPIDPQDPELAALLRGPVVLAALADDKETLRGPISAPAAWIHPVRGDELTYRAEPSGQTFRPFYLLGPERYTIYSTVLPPPK